MTIANQITLAQEYAQAAINAEMRPGTANAYTCPSQLSNDTVRLGELYASEVLGALSPASREEMVALESALSIEV